MLSPEQKEKLRISLSEEQGGECCYCMTLLEKLDGKHTVIEHQFPRNPIIPEDRNQGLDYDNLFLSCGGNSGQGIFTCDAAKGRQVFKKLDLTDKAVMDTIYFDESNGTVHSDDEDVESDIKDILNLDDPNSSLYKRRFYAMSELEESLCSAGNEEELLDNALEYYEFYSEPETRIHFKEMFLYVLRDILGDIVK